MDSANVNEEMGTPDEASNHADCSGFLSQGNEVQEEAHDGQCQQANTIQKQRRKSTPILELLDLYSKLSSVGKNKEKRKHSKKAFVASDNDIKRRNDFLLLLPRSNETEATTVLSPSKEPAQIFELGKDLEFEYEKEDNFVMNHYVNIIKGDLCLCNNNG
ncbi:hypothetical protein GH714_024141 [Hevea brasiliensis]|uniref:Uncharacterized protein n=1 Tax=Hevea brasiliensis TaxID=3981 RepID=A0A6A6LR22_HEVBR|nr:hypothetical protein GH714_024141 [Hevea brasiliensis]